MRKVTFLVVHHTASSKTTVEQIRKWHKERGFSDIGYHAVIYGDGSLHRGRPEDKIGAHALGANAGSLGISVCGNFAKDSLEDKQFKTNSSADWCVSWPIGVANTEWMLLTFSDTATSDPPRQPALETTYTKLCRPSGRMCKNYLKAG